MIEILLKPVDRIGIGVTQALIASKVPESEQIEFKKTLPYRKRNADPWVSGEGRVGDCVRDTPCFQLLEFSDRSSFKALSSDATCR